MPKTRRSMIQAGRAAADGLAEHGQTALEAVKDQIDQVGGDGALAERAERALEAGRAALDGVKGAATGAAGAVAAAAERLHPGSGADEPVTEPVPATPTDQTTPAHVGPLGMVAGTPSEDSIVHAAGATNATQPSSTGA